MAVLNEDVLRQVFWWYLQLEGPFNINRWFKLLRVSNTWRTTALDDAALWTSIHVRSERQVSFMLVRAKDCLVDVVLSPGSPQAARDMVMNTSGALRMRSLDIRGPAFDQELLMHSISAHKTPLQFPVLSVLSVHDLGQGEVDFHHFVTALREMPALEEFNFRAEGDSSGPDEQTSVGIVERLRLRRLSLCAKATLCWRLYRSLRFPPETQCEITAVFRRGLRSNQLRARQASLCRTLAAAISRANELTSLDTMEIQSERRPASMRAHAQSNVPWEQVNEIRLHTDIESKHPLWVVRCVYEDGLLIAVQSLPALVSLWASLPLRAVTFYTRELVPKHLWEALFTDHATVRTLHVASKPFCGLLGALDPEVSPNFLFPHLQTLIVDDGSCDEGISEIALDMLADALRSRPVELLVFQDCSNILDEAVTALLTHGCAGRVERRPVAHTPGAPAGPLSRWTALVHQLRFGVPVSEHASTRY